MNEHGDTIRVPYTTEPSKDDQLVDIIHIIQQYISQQNLLVLLLSAVIMQIFLQLVNSFIFYTRLNIPKALG